MSSEERLFSFAGGASGAWKVVRSTAIRGAPLSPVGRLEMIRGSASVPSAGWLLRGVVSNARYVTREESDALARIQPGLGRPESTHAAMIPVRKSHAWWALAQDERRAILEDRSRHIAMGLEYLPAIARQLHHCRDLGEPFDFITWFEFAPRDEARFDELVERLRRSLEWEFVQREVDVRLVREG